MKSAHRKQWKNLLKRGVALAAAGLMMLSIISPTDVDASTAGQPLSEKYTGFDGVEVEWKYGSSDDTPAYVNYESSVVASVDYATEDIEVPLESVTDENGDALEVAEYEGVDAILSGSDSEYIEFTVTVPEDGLYQLEFDYYLDPSSTDPGKRILYVDDEMPFE
ncbi:MAG: hypothetical protein LUG56_10150, partial [Lachnospiraceae bacterium]|nr:hypothetical protein [Lachnospiraceae bacterium]